MHSDIHNLVKPNTAEASPLGSGSIGSQGPGYLAERNMDIDCASRSLMLLNVYFVRGSGAWL